MNVTRHFQVAIIGAGFCGTMVAVNLARHAPGLSVALIERGDAPGKGLAYGTSDSAHLLNVRAGQMGAFADDAGHFHRWLQAQPEWAGFSAQDFAPRLVYGRYLQELLGQARAANPKLEVLQGAMTDMRRLPQGGFELTGAGETITAGRVVLALGNFPPDKSGADTPYAPETWRRLAQAGDVLIVGTGLTSLDLVVTLARTKTSGVVHLLSRHGLLPREHTDPQPYTLKLQAPYPATALGLLRAIRGEVAAAGDVPWQSVVDALRPLNQHFWQSMGGVEQRRFMRHARAYWDVHRHRCAPRVMDAYRALEKQGRILLHHGSIVTQTAQGDGWHVLWRPRGHTAPEQFTVRQIVRCTGPQADFRKLDDVLVQNLFAHGLIAADALHMGIMTAGDYAVCDADGRNVDGLYALGSMLKGRFYESVAVPELRAQAAAIAALIAQEKGR